MDILRFQKTDEKFKILNATNGGPWYKRNTTDQYRSNFEDYKAARIPYSRNHDSNISGTIYGGPYAHDISVIFPNFDADVNNPESYDFACTDESILATLEAGTKTFFRLGQSIEFQIKKHGTLPPKDFSKWADICEHIIRHYNEGWADGFKLNIEYWEIWNEPDASDGANKPTWGGTKEQFFDLYSITAKHLKKCFPGLKIGGPSLSDNEEWAKDFLSEMKRRDVAIDFFSWHIYCAEPTEMIGMAQRIKKLLVDTGYGDTESILNEWNYVKGWTELFVYSIKSLIGIKGAAFIMACIAESQKTECIDMLMYYDTRPSAFCGAFDFYTYEKRKGYYPLAWYGQFYDMKRELRCVNEPESIYTLCGEDDAGKILCVVTNYSDDDGAPNKEIKLDFGKQSEYEIYLVDKDHDGELVKTIKDLVFYMKNQSLILIKEI